MEHIDLAGYLIVHRMKTCMVMMFSNPDRRTRLLLSYFLKAIETQYVLTVRASLLKGIISMCRQEYDRVLSEFKGGRLEGAEVLKTAKELKHKAREAEKELSRLTNA